MHYYEVAPTVIVRQGNDTFTYCSDEVLAIGVVCVISIGKTTRVGIVMREVTKPAYDVKAIESTLPIPALPQPFIDCANWLSRYYHTPLATVLQTMLPSGITKNRRKQKETSVTLSRKRTNFVLNNDQQHAVSRIKEATGQTVLLHGITGSGKTAVYIDAARHAIKQQRSVIILVPEIALTSQLVADFSHQFDNVILTHSKQTEAQRHMTWLEALNAKQPQVVIGPRSALFMPLESVGLIVLDEFHEPSFKQEQAPRYSAARLAKILAIQHNAALVLGSATPPIADYYLAENSKDVRIQHLLLPAQTGTVKPTIDIVDMTKRGNFSKHTFLSDSLLSQIHTAINAGKQALIFHNRRGSASVTLCENCGWNAGCPRCYVPLTLHIDNHTLSCHICATTMKVPTSCPQCHTAEIIHRGIGTKRIESELRRLFPNHSIARFDGDTHDKETIDNRYSELYDGSVDIIIGTQVVAKGLDLPHLRAVGIVQADAGLSLPDFMSSERTFQLLSQVVGRVGRSHHPTNVVVQTYQPTHPAILDGINQNYQDFYTRTITQRHKTNFPPFCHILKLTCVYKTEKAAIANAKKLQHELRRIIDEDVEILGPTPSFYERMRDTYRWQLVVKSSQREKLLNLLDYVPTTHWQYELDPVSLL